MTGRRKDNAIRGLVYAFGPYLLFGIGIIAWLVWV